MSEIIDVAVIGAGLAGLSVARTLQRAGLDVVVLEASDGVGGRVRTDTVDGFLLDRGFQVLLTAYPEAHRQLDMAALDLRAFDPGALVWRGGRGHVVSDPFRQPTRALSTALAPIGSPVDKARIALLRRRLRAAHPAALLADASHDTSTRQMLSDLGFSDTVVNRFFRPLFAGIQLDPELATSRRMFDVIFRMLADGQSTVPATGMGAIPAQIAADLAPGTVRLDWRATLVTTRRDDHREVTAADGRSVAARTVVVATDGPVASRLLGTPEVASRPVSCVYFAAPTAPVRSRYVVLDGTGTGPVLNVAVMSNVAPTYAPPGRHLVAAALPGVLDDGDEPLAEVARRQLRSWWGTGVDEWQHLRTYSISHGQPDQRPPLHPKRAVFVDEGLFVCGDHRDTGSIQGALFSGRRCADAILEART